MSDDLYAAPEAFAHAEERLHDVVAKLVGSADVGGDDYRPGLRALLRSIDYDTRLNERGRRDAWGRLIEVLAARARAVRSMKDNPGFERTVIHKPIVITGVPRTGTTALHKLMAVDPQVQGLESWLLSSPMPRPPRAEWDSHPQFLRTADEIAARYELSPGAKAAHARAAEEVDECLAILAQGFASNYWASCWMVPSYDAWWQTQSERPAYQHLRRVIQLVGSNEPEKRWLLKNPGHIANLDLLFEIFPDARVIQTHRDPAKAIPSLTALLGQFIDPVETGRNHLRGSIIAHRETEKWAKAVHDCEAVRRSHPGQVMDVIHTDFHRDPIGVVQLIYDFCELTLSDEVEAAMRARISDDPERSHGTHRYDVADYGLSEDDIRDRFGSYIDRYDLRPVRARA
jgi:hypothetical protein